jgi:S-sulfo-L-cysteine synthase (3-phospho-L-serine-dependent)
MKKKRVVGLVEPSFYGVRYVKATYEQGYKIVIITSSNENPRKYG